MNEKAVAEFVKASDDLYAVARAQEDINRAFRIGSRPKEASLETLTHKAEVFVAFRAAREKLK